MRRRFFSLALVAAVALMTGCHICDHKVESTKFSVFTGTISRVSKERGVSLNEAAALLMREGVAGFDANYKDVKLGEFVQSGMKPINLYGKVNFLEADNGEKASVEFVAAAVKYRVPRIMVIPDSFSDNSNQEADYARIRDGLRSLVAIAKTAGVVVMVEDFGGERNPCSYMKYLKRFLSEIPDLKFALDSGNLHYAGRGEDILEMMRFAQGRIDHVHLKDQEREQNRKYVTLGTGAVPNEAIVRHMHKTGYKGWHTLENLVGDDVLTDVRRQVAIVRAWRE